MLNQGTYSFDLPEPITASNFIGTILRKINTGNIEGCVSYGANIISDITYLVLQRVEPLPENLPNYSELSSLGTRLIMSVKPKVRSVVEFQQAFEKARESPLFNERTYIKQLRYNKFIVEVEREGEGIVTHDVIEKVRNELHGI